MLLTFNPTNYPEKCPIKTDPGRNDGKALAKVSQDEVASFAAGMALAQHWRVWDVALKLGDSWPNPLGLVIAVSEVLFRLVLTYIFLRWCECVLNKRIWSCSLAWEVGDRAQQVFCWDPNSSCGQQISFPWRMDPAHDVDPRRMRNCAIFWLGRVLFFRCHFFGCFFRLATCKLLDDRPQMALFTGMFQLKKVWGWDKLINSILSCAQITQVLLLSEYQLFNFHHDWGGRSGERGWNSTFGKSSFFFLGQVGDRVWYGATLFFCLGGRCQR